MVTGGTFYRTYDGVDLMDKTKPATVSSFRLDKYEITVGRFRGFIDAWSAGWRPATGAGKHSYLNGGKGVVSDDGSYEGGWDPSWNTQLPTDRQDWDNDLVCFTPGAGYTPNPGSHEHRPVDCLSWYAAYAFCIWDGGFLPSEAESNYAAAGGNQQRVFPWSNPPTSTSVDCSYANYKLGIQNFCVSAGNGNDVGSESPKGDGRYGQADLAGNVAEWILDWDGPLPLPCDDCARLSGGTNRITHGGSGYTTDNAIRAGAYFDVPPGKPTQGARCARAP